MREESKPQGRILSKPEGFAKAGDPSTLRKVIGTAIGTGLWLCYLFLRRVYRSSWRSGKTGQTSQDEGNRTTSGSATASLPEAQPSEKLHRICPKDLQALRDAVVDAATVGAGLWLSYLFVFFYLSIAAAAVTHRDLFFNRPVKLPFLGVDLPLLGFFFLGPGLFLIVHAYVLLHFALLASKVGAFDTQLRLQLPEQCLRTIPRWSARGALRCNGVLAAANRANQPRRWPPPAPCAVPTPVSALPQRRDYLVAEAHVHRRFGAIVDIVALGRARRKHAARVATFAAVRLRPRLLLVAAVLLVCSVATFPGEWLDSNLPSINFIPTGLPTKWPSLIPPSGGVIREWTSVHDLLVAGGDNGLRPSLWSNRLILPNADLVDDAPKSDAGSERFTLKGGRLEGAVFRGARLRKVDFSDAQLQGAVFFSAEQHTKPLGVSAIR